MILEFKIEQDEDTNIMVINLDDEIAEVQYS